MTGANDEHPHRVSLRNSLQQIIIRVAATVPAYAVSDVVLIVASLSVYFIMHVSVDTEASILIN